MKKKSKLIDCLKKILNNYSKWTPPKILIIILLFEFAFLGVTCLFSIDNDFWFLVNTGKYILNNGFPHIEPFTIHSNLDFIAQQWLSSTIFYLIYNKFGTFGMLILLIIINLVVVFIVYNLSMLLSEGKAKLSFLTTIIFDTFFTIMYLKTRPQSFDAILLILEIYLLESYVKKGKKYYLIGLPILSILMINLHSSIWLMLFVLLIPYFIERIKYFSKEKYKIKPLLIVALLMFICGLFNPYGIEAVKYLFNSYGVDTINKLVREMNPLTLTNGFYVFVYIALIAYSFYYNKGKNKLRYFLLVLGTLYLAFNHYRGILFFIICTLPAINYNFKDLSKEKGNQSFLHKNKSTNNVLIFSLIICVLAAGNTLLSLDLEKRTNTSLYEVGEYFQNNVDVDAVIYTGYDEGGYLEYLGYKCYLDPRAEVFLKANNHKEDILMEYYNLQTRQLYYEEFLKKYHFDYILVKENDILYYELEHTNYEKIYDVTNKNISYKIYKKPS